MRGVIIAGAISGPGNSTARDHKQRQEHGSGPAINGPRPEDLFRIAIYSPLQPPLPLTDTDRHSLIAAPDDRLSVQASTIVLLRCAGDLTDYDAHAEVAAAQEKLRKARRTQHDREKTLKDYEANAGAMIDQAIAKPDPPGLRAVKRGAIARNNVYKKSSIEAEKAELEWRICRAVAAPYEAVSEAVLAYREKYKAEYTKDGKTSVGRVIEEINDPTENTQHPALNLLHSLKPELGARASEAERLIRYILVKTVLADEGSTGL